MTRGELVDMVADAAKVSLHWCEWSVWVRKAESNVVVLQASSCIRNRERRFIDLGIHVDQISAMRPQTAQDYVDDAVADVSKSLRLEVGRQESGSP